MTQIAIQTQIEVIKKATKEALKSKESALKFLVDAGIIREKKDDGIKTINTKKK